MPGFGDKLKDENRIILFIRPGITDPATLAFKNEEGLLAEQENPEQYNREVIWPEEVQVNKEYIKTILYWKTFVLSLKRYSDKNRSLYNFRYF